MLLWMLQTEQAISRRAPVVDEALLARIAAGDGEALESLYRQTSTAVYGFILSIVNNEHDAEELMQDVYLRVDAAAGTYQPQGKPMAWILAIARNLALMRRRETAKNAPDGFELLEKLPAPKDLTEERVLLSAALQTLGEEERQIVMLHAVAGLKHREIAQMLQLTLTGTLTKYRRALAKLRRTLTEGDDHA